MRSRRHVRPHGGVMVALIAGTLLVGCLGPDGDDAATVDSTLAPPPVIASVAPPPERSSPFCAGMSQLYNELEQHSDDDEVATIVAAYTELLPSVPVELVPDFRQVIADLQAGTPAGATLPSVPDTGLSSVPSSVAPGTAPSTSVEDFEEGYDPDESAAGRVNAYVQFACTGGQNNPGPQATQPDEVVVPDTEP